MPRRRVLALLAALVPSLAVGIALLPGEGRAAKDELVIGITQFPSTLHPNIDAMAAKTYVLAMAQRPFTTYDPEWQLICMLCTELPTLENGLAKIEQRPDGSEGIALTYTIQPGATWGDGTPVTTEDVMFTYAVGSHPQSGVTNAELYRRITAIDVVDDKTFVMHVDRVTFQYNAINDFRIVPAHLEREVFEQNPAGYRNRTRFDTDPTNPGLYFGPYRITEVASGAHVVLEPNPTWWGEPPHFQRIVIRVIENTAALEANLLSGSIDMIAGELGLTIDQALAFEKRHGDRFQIVYEPGLTYEHIDLNLDNPILADVRVRKALLMGLDREALNEQLFGGRQPVAHTSVNPLDWVHYDDVPRYEEDLEAAAALLDEAGWDQIRGGVRHNAAGEPLRLELMTTAGNRTRELVQQVLQSQWQRIGVDVRIRNEPARVFFGETMTKRRFRAMAMYAWISSPENVPRSTLHSEEIPTEANGWSGQNYPGYRNPEMDRLIDAIEVELDRDKREKMWHRLQEIYAEDLPALPLYFRANPHVWPLWLEGVTPTGHQYSSALWVEHWRSRAS
ncbi:MAG TPA: peptide ABC transporter substrate-binding protein [Geminicoccaceae bacterium]|nr:peptide ABC transporter substrate-binding protein [Geminicoccaceae bacterium]